MLTYQVSVTFATVSFEPFVLIPDLMKKCRPKFSMISGMRMNSLDEIVPSMFPSCNAVT